MHYYIDDDDDDDVLYLPSRNSVAETAPSQDLGRVDSDLGRAKEHGDGGERRERGWRFHPRSDVKRTRQVQRRSDISRWYVTNV